MFIEHNRYVIDILVKQMFNKRKPNVLMNIEIN